MICFCSVLLGMRVFRSITREKSELFSCHSVKSYLSVFLAIFHGRAGKLPLALHDFCLLSCTLGVVFASVPANGSVSHFASKTQRYWTLSVIDIPA